MSKQTTWDAALAILVHEAKGASLGLKAGLEKNPHKIDLEAVSRCWLENRAEIYSACRQLAHSQRIRSASPLVAYCVFQCINDAMRRAEKLRQIFPVVGCSVPELLELLIVDWEMIGNPEE